MNDFKEFANIVNYKNIAEVSVTCCPRFNCFIGNNGVGKTNILDAVYSVVDV